MPDKLKFPIYLICFSILLPAMSHADDTQKKALSQEAISIVKQFGGTLKPALKKALKSEGPVKAIEICSEKAPQIAADLSKKTGWTVKRVSLKPRNSESAIPDAWETKVLKSFDQRQAQGESAKKMAFAEIVNGEFRFMKAQGVEAVCLNCHATEIKPVVEAKIKEIYPDDQARGYSKGQIRGAFSLTKKL